MELPRQTNCCHNCHAKNAWLSGEHYGADWSLWLADYPAIKPAMVRNQHFDTMDLAISAAIQGFGIAIADEALVAEDIRMGRLVRPFAHSVRTGASYRLTVRPGSENIAGLEDFCESLLTPG